jgi:K(+)-stimulated pyrophosphate-energized sodium pump
MENLMTNMSVWGIVVLLLTTLRLAWRSSVVQGTGWLIETGEYVFQKFNLFIRHSYKPLTLFALSAFTLFVCYRITGDKFVSLWSSASVAGIMSIGLGALLRPGISQYVLSLDSLSTRKEKFIKKVCSEKNINNNGILFISLTGLLLVSAAYLPSVEWTSYTVLSLTGGFALGASGLLLCLHVYEVITIPYTDSYSTFAAQASRILSNDRLDTLGGTLVAAMLLGTTFCPISSFQSLNMPASSVLLPLVLAISGVGVSSVFASMASVFNWKQNPISYLTEKLASALLMILIAFGITQYLLPASWVCNGIEYTSMQVFYSVQAGVIGGLLTNKVIQIYKTVHRKYFNYLAEKSFRVSLMDSAFHFLLNTVSTLLPVVLIVLSILFSYELVGLYGIVIAMVAMLANLSTKLTVGR